MRIQSKEFSIVQHYGGGRDIPRTIDTDELQTTHFASEMSDSVMMESTVLQACG